MILTPTNLIIRYYGISKHFTHGSGILSFISPKGLKQEKSQRKLERDKALMRILEEERPDTVETIMGGDLNRMEPTKMENFRDRMATWYLLKEGGFLPYMMSMAGYDENCALQFVNSWNERKVTINGITFQVSEEVIAMATGLNMKGKKWKKVTKVPDEASMNNFFAEDEEPVRYRGGFKRDKLPEPWDDVCLVLMRYLTLEGRFGVCYYYHFPLLNHFRNRDFISIPFFLLHSLEDMINDVREKKSKGLNFTIIHQGLIFRLYQFHLALCPPREVVVDNPHHNPNSPPSSTMGTRIHTPRPSPSKDSKKKKKSDMGLEQKDKKKIKVDKVVEVVGEDSSEDVGGTARRRSGRLAQSQARFKQKSIRYPVEEVEEETSGNSSGSREEVKMSKSKKEEGKEEEKSFNSGNISMQDTHNQGLDGEERVTETTHVSASFSLKPISFCDEKSKKNSSPITISSPVKDNLKISSNPRMLQDTSQELKLKEPEEKTVEDRKEQTEVIEQHHGNLEKRVKALEEGFLTFSKFGLKVTHAAATTLQLLAQEKEEEGLDMEDHKLLFKFLADDWAQILLHARGKGKKEN